MNRFGGQPLSVKYTWLLHRPNLKKRKVENHGIVTTLILKWDDIGATCPMGMRF